MPAFKEKICLKLVPNHGIHATYLTRFRSIENIVRIHQASFGSHLYALRKGKRVSQAVVADRAGIGRGYYSQLENSKKSPPSGRLLQRIVAALALDEGDAQRLAGLAVAERFKATCDKSAVDPCVAELVRFLVQSSNRLTAEKVVRIEAILSEE